MALKIPKIGFGCYNIPRSQTAKCVVEALESGYRLIDIIYTSKLWDDSFGTERAREGFEDSFKKAGEPIDLYLLHSSGDGPRERKESYLVLEQMVKEGKLKHIGVSNWGIHHLKELDSYASIKPVVNQIEVNPWKRMNELVEYCQSNGIVVECYSPLTLGKKLQDPELKALGQKYDSLSDEELKELGDPNGYIMAIPGWDPTKWA